MLAALVFTLVTTQAAAPARDVLCATVDRRAREWGRKVEVCVQAGPGCFCAKRIQR